MSRLRDFLGPRGDTVQVILKKRGKPVAGIYKDDEREIRSPTLKEEEVDEKTDRNSR
jgi:hypothetical protein